MDKEWICFWSVYSFVHFCCCPVCSPSSLITVFISVVVLFVHRLPWSLYLFLLSCLFTVFPDHCIYFCCRPVCSPSSLIAVFIFVVVLFVHRLPWSLYLFLLSCLFTVFPDHCIYFCCPVCSPSSLITVFISVVLFVHRLPWLLSLPHPACFWVTLPHGICLLLPGSVCLAPVASFLLSCWLEFSLQHFCPLFRGTPIFSLFIALQRKSSKMKISETKCMEGA